MRMILTAVLAASAFSILSFSAFAADSPKPLFARDEVINFTLGGPIVGMSRKADAKPVAGTLKLAGNTPGRAANYYQ